MASDPHILIYHGDDEETLRAALAKIEAEQQATGLAELNYQTLDGKSLNSETFSNSVYAIPFIAPERVVVLRNPLALAGDREGNKRFTALLESIPETTRLILVIPDKIERKDWVELPAKSFLRKWVGDHGNIARLTTFARPTIANMRNWIIAKAVELGGQIEPGAAKQLVGMLGNDTGEVKQALDKLLLYVDYKRPVDENDVHELVNAVTSVNIFDMIDQLVAGNARESLDKLHRLAEEQEIPSLLAMIVRQFRLLIQTREILDEGGSVHTVQSELGQIEFVAKKLVNQARAFSYDRLRDCYGELVAIDRGIKTSQTDPMTALDLFVVQIATEKRR